MFFFWPKKNWEDEYDEYYAQGRGVHDGKPRTYTRYLAHVLLLSLVAGVFVAGVGFVGGKTMVEKLATSIFSPVGFVWCILVFVIYFSLLNRKGWMAIGGLVCWLTLTIGGNQLVANFLSGTLESAYQDINPYELDAMEVVVVLGGGTNTTVSGQSQLASNGDRIAVAARMYHCGKAKKIVCTGSQSLRQNELDLHPREEAANILLGLGIPQASILQMKGDNTSQEMKNLKAWLDQNSVDGPVGVITSAWHLDRTMRLAKSNGLEPIPIPANFITEPFTPSPNLVVPDAYNLMKTGRVCKEFLARLAGR